ncbi:MAG: hypothetical protein KY457_06505 [Actinobacteria bacterium]|nr:hypothetical protein [Actinomycetota bacterium]
MSLRTRAFLVVGGAVLLALVMFGVIAQAVVVAGFADLEEADAAERLQRITSALEADLEGQLAITRSYAEEPDAALVLRGMREALYPWRGTPVELRHADIDAILLLDGLGRPVLTLTDGSPLPAALERRLRDNTLRVSETGASHVSGLVTSEAGVAAFVSHQVRADAAVPLGTVVSVRQVDASYRERLSGRAFVDATLAPVADRGFRMSPAPWTPEGARTVENDDVVHATAYLTDPAGWYTVEVSTEVPRAIAAAGREAAERLFLLILVATLVAGGLLLLWFERRLLSRLARLTDLVTRSETRDRPVVSLEGSDELSSLAERIERTLGSLELAQEALRRSNAELAVASRMKDDFVSMVSHEFRTPLTSIRGYAETMLRYADELGPDKRERFTERITAQTRVLERMVDDLLTLAQSREGTVRAFPEEVTLVGAVEDALRDLDDPSIVVVEVDGSLVVHADRDHVRRILINYIENARKYGQAPVHIQAEASTAGVEVRVRDHGPGVPSEFVPALFDRFSQASVGTKRTARGVGLGLSIVRTLATVNDGDVWYEPAAPGAVFGVRLPAGASGSPAVADAGAERLAVPTA